MQTIELGQDWRMIAARDVQGASPADPDCDTTRWIPAAVPTTAQATLVEAGVVTEPWLDRNYQRFEPFEGDTWWFRREFTLDAVQAPADAVILVLEGVTLACTVWINGSPVGFTRNAHHAHRFDVTPHIQRTGPNVIALECRLDIEAARKRVRKDVSKDADEYRVYLRTCQMSSGWDFAPRLPVAGPWRPVRLECHRAASLEDVHVRTEAIERGTAALAVSVTTRAWAPCGSIPTVRLSIHEEPDAPPVWQGEAAVGAGFPASVAVQIPKARLWFPHPIGEPFLYTLKAELVVDGAVTDRHVQRFGARTVELKQDARFTFCINGVDVFARGANWVPPDTLTLDTTADQYRHLLGLAHDAHFNMLRVWGGGTYENPAFYALCDEFGIMVWQDFMYACAMFPDDEPEFMETADREAREAVTRLRRHPSVVLWCGNNECQEAWELGDWPERSHRHMGERLYDHVLPNAVRQLAPGTPYWPGSPYGGPTTRSRSEGDFHDWYSFPEWRRYDANAPRFSSEYGFRSVPHRDTVDTMISPQYQWDPHGPQNVVWKAHHGWCGWMRDLLPEFGAPATLDEWIMCTQEAQATMMRYAVEVYRRRMFETSGSLMWQYNEPWPAATFSLVDYYGRAKAAYYWSRHAHAPVIGLFYGGHGPLEFWGVSDLPAPAECTVRWRRWNHDGALLGDATLTATLAANGATQIASALPHGIAIEDAAHEFLHAELTCGDQVCECVHHAGLRKDWRLPAADLRCRVVAQAPGEITLELRSDAYVHWTSVTVADPRAWYSDNFVDVLPGIPRVVTVRGDIAGGARIAAANARPLHVGA